MTENSVGKAVEPAWTGEEILSQELQRLTTELVALRRQKEQLAGELMRREAAPVLAPYARLAAVPRSWVTVGSLLVASAALAALCHTVVLEAQPPVLNGSPGMIFSVQVGVYDVKPAAQRFLDALSQEGYPAFLVEGRTRRGAPRYRVYVGRYTSKVEAQVHLDLMKRNPRLQDSFILRRR
ncbi:MAG: SPOR domain-containing protein [Candidatus Omnitrophica bacterium]|nr:SPOR domain-containing protein [Candidatus Omnitrophota bacterium]